MTNNGKWCTMINNKEAIWFVESCTGSVEKSWVVWLVTNSKNGESKTAQEVLLPTRHGKLLT